MDRHPNAPPREEEDLIRVPPHNEDAERAVIGSVFLDNDCYPLIAERLPGKECFYKHENRVVWDAICSVMDDDDYEPNDDSARVDVITVADWLDARDKLESIGGPQVLTKYSSAVPSSANVGRYVEIVRRDWISRSAIIRADAATHALYESEKPDEIISKLGDDLTGLLDTGTTESRSSPNAVAKMTLQHIEDALTGKVKGVWPTGVPMFDKLLDGGVMNNQGYVLAARSGHGKSSVASRLVGGLAHDHDFLVHWWSTEIPEHFQAIRLMCAVFNLYESWFLHPDRIEKAAVRERFHAASIRAITWFKESGVHIFRKGSPNVRDVAMKARAARMRDPDRPLIIVADYIQRFTAGIDDKYRDVSAASTAMMDLALDLDNTVVLLLSQFTTPSSSEEKTPIPMPKPINARFSKEIENDARNFLTYHRPYKGDPAWDNFAVLELAKATYGLELGHILLRGKGGTHNFDWWMGQTPDVPHLNTPRVTEHD